MLIMNKLNIRPSKFDIHPEYHEKFGIHISIEYRKEDEKGTPMFCLVINGNVVHKDGSLEYEGLPSSRTEKFIQSTRFYYDDVVALANQVVPPYLKAYFNKPYTKKFINDQPEDELMKKIKQDYWS